MSVKNTSDHDKTATSDWLPPSDDPADLFALLYDSLPDALTRKEPRQIGELLDGWYADPEVQRCADRVERMARDATLGPGEIHRAVPSGVGRATFAVLLGLDRALRYAHPRLRGPDMAGLSPVALRYLRTGRFNTDRVEGALLPRNSPFDDGPTDPFADSFCSVVRIPEAVWAGVDLRRVPTHADIGRRAAFDELLLAVVPLLARDDLTLVTARVAEDRLVYRLIPRDTVHLRERIRSVLSALDRSGATIAVLPEPALSTSLLEHWRQLLLANPAPPESKLKWILVGAGALEDGPRPPIRAVVLDRDMGEVLFLQDKLLPSSLDTQQLVLWGLDDDLTEGDAAKEVHEDVTVGTVLSVIDSSVGRVAIAVGDQPSELQPALRQVSHLLRPSLDSQARFQRVAQMPDAAGGLRVTSGLLLPDRDPATPLGAGIIALPHSDGHAATSQDMVVTEAFQPDEVQLVSLRAGAPEARIRQYATEAGPARERSRVLHELRAMRIADQGALLRTGPHTLERLMASVHPADESRHVATGLQLLAHVLAVRGQLTAAQQAIDRVIPVARASDGQFLEAEARETECVVRYWGNQPLDAVVEQVTTTLRWADAHGYPRLEATASYILARAQARRGRFDSAAGLVRRGAEIGHELLGPERAILTADDATTDASVLLLSGDLDGAAAALDRGDRTLTRMQMTRLRAPILALSARVRYQLDAYDDANDLLDECEELVSSENVGLQVGCRGVRALLLAHQGEYLWAEQLARSAVEIGDWSERLDLQAQARVDLTHVLRSAGRLAEATYPAARALDLYEQKGDVVSAAEVREILPADAILEVRRARAEAWLLDPEPRLIAGRTATIAFQLHATREWVLGLSSGRPEDPQEALVMLVAATATVEPSGQRLHLPDDGPSEPITFQVTPKNPEALRLRFLVHLYQEGTLLIEFGVTMPVLPS